MNLLSLDNRNRFTAMSQYQKQSNILTHIISTVLCAGHPGWTGTRNDQTLSSLSPTVSTISLLHLLHAKASYNFIF